MTKAWSLLTLSEVQSITLTVGERAGAVAETFTF